MRYKVGDKVIVRSDLVGETEYHGILFAYEMCKYKRRKATIVEITTPKLLSPSLPNYRYKLDIDNKRWFWIDEFLLSYGIEEFKNFIMKINKA